MIAGLMAEGRSKIYNISHILRGYENISGDFSSLGANIKTVRE